MGGSGGWFFSDEIDPEALSRRVREAEAQTQDQQFETEVAGLIGSLLSQYNDRDVETINTHLDTIKNALGKDIDGTADLLYGGSVAKHTYVDGLSDIDALVLLDKSELKGKSPQEVKEYFVSRLKERLPKTPIESGTLAVTVKFKDAEIQLLPAIRYKSGFRIADTSGKRWSFIKPSEFANQLTKVNQEMGGKVVPTIKLAKSIISALPENRRLTGYHTEALAVEVFRQYDGTKTPKAMLKHFFLEAPKYVLEPITDRTGQSTHVDDYLGPANNLKRQTVADSLNRIGRRMENADGARLIQQWRDILGIS